MKSRYVRLIALVLLLLFSLTSCGTPTPAPQPQESESTTTTTTTTTTTAEAETTTTTTETTTTTTTAATTAITTKKTTKPTTTKPATTQTTKTTKKTTTATTEPDPNAPYEDNSLAPGKDKQRLVLNMLGEEIEMTFEKALVYPKDYDRLMWHYTGTTKTGVRYTCEVVAEQERISKISCPVKSDWGLFTEKEAIACIKQFFKPNKVPGKLEERHVSLAHSRIVTGPNGEHLQQTIGRFGIPLGDDFNKCSGVIYYNDGKPYVSELTAKTWSGAWIPGYSGDDIPLLIPRWKSE